MSEVKKPKDIIGQEEEKVKDRPKPSHRINPDTVFCVLNLLNLRIKNPLSGGTGRKKSNGR